MIRANFGYAGKKFITPEYAVQCMAADKEYMSSPAGDYFGSTIDGLYVEIDYINAGSNAYFMSQVIDNGNYIQIAKLSDKLRVNIRAVSSGGDSINSYDFPSGEFPISGNIKLIGVGTNLEFKLDDTTITTFDCSSAVMPDLSSVSLLFSSDNILADSNLTFLYIKINSHEWTSPNWAAPTTLNSQGVVTTLHTKDVVTGVKCIAANNEYLSSPAGNYFGNTVDGFSFIWEYSDKPSTTTYGISQRLDASNLILISISNTLIRLQIRSSTSNPATTYLFDTSAPTSGKIEYKGVGNNLELYFNDILVQTYDLTSVVFPDLSSSELLFSSYNGNYYDNTINYIKINSHEWLADAWTAPTTTNSQGVVTTLNSDVSTSAMIQGTPGDTTQMIIRTN